MEWESGYTVFFLMRAETVDDRSVVMGAAIITVVITLRLASCSPDRPENQVYGIQAMTQQKSLSTYANPCCRGEMLGVTEFAIQKFGCCCLSLRNSSCPVNPGNG